MVREMSARHVHEREQLLRKLVFLDAQLQRVPVRLRDHINRPLPVEMIPGLQRSASKHSRLSSFAQLEPAVATTYRCGGPQHEYITYSQHLAGLFEFGLGEREPVAGHRSPRARSILRVLGTWQQHILQNLCVLLNGLWKVVDGSGCLREQQVHWCFAVRPKRLHDRCAVCRGRDRKSEALSSASSPPGSAGCVSSHSEASGISSPKEPKGMAKLAAISFQTLWSKSSASRVLSRTRARSSRRRSSSSSIATSCIFPSAPRTGTWNMPLFWSCLPKKSQRRPLRGSRLSVVSPSGRKDAPTEVMKCPSSCSR
eukprot:scaffold1467_cov264-Pinguiococcus_pyrenoidosus.AAC.2